MARRSSRWIHGTGLWLAAIGVAGLVGCAGPERTDPDEPTDASGSTEGEGLDGVGEDDSLADSAAATARQLEEALARSQPALEDDSGQRIEWVETWPDRPSSDHGADEPDASDATGAATGASADADAARTSEPRSPGDADDATAGPDADEPAAPPPPDELLRMLLSHVRDANEPAMRRALTAATLSAAVGDAGLDAQVLGPLGYTQRRTVERYHRMVLALLEQMGDSDAPFDRAALLERIDALFEHEPIEIRKLALCREVSGYGIYEPFERHAFLAGRNQRLILYLEIDHFRAEPTDDNRYEVQLEQEVVLYNEADGLAVWRQDPVRITDVSRNRRRDFFTVQLVTLPQRLSVGHYRLKVRVTDQHGGSLDETTTRIRLVADEKLLEDQ